MMKAKRQFNIQGCIKCKIFCVLCLSVLILSVVFQIVMTNGIALKGDEFMKLTQRKENLEKDLSKLEYEDSKYSSLSYIDIKAKELGFVSMKDPLQAIENTTPSVAVVTSY